MRTGFARMTIVTALILMKARACADEPPHRPPADAALAWEWSFKAGAGLDADGRPEGKAKSAWTWGVAIGGSFRLSWGERQAATKIDVPSDPPSMLDARLIELTNAERKKIGLPALKPDPALMRLAREQSAHMAKLQKISHELEGRTFSLRMKEAEYQAFAAGENCAEGADSPEQAVSDWMMSPGHKANIVSDKYTRLGVGVSADKNGRQYFTQIFAKPFEDRLAPSR